MKSVPLPLTFCTHASQVTDALKRYSYLLGQTDLFRHFVDVQVRPESLLHDVSAFCAHSTFQKSRNPEYAAILDAEPKAKGRGRKRGP
jgi:SWI/SNF-related matrix-associated actin-dependent regulator of chromatin subfamily A member 5